MLIGVDAHLLEHLGFLSHHDVGTRLGDLGLQRVQLSLRLLQFSAGSVDGLLHGLHLGGVALDGCAGIGPQHVGLCFRLLKNARCLGLRLPSQLGASVVRGLGGGAHVRGLLLDGGARLTAHCCGVGLRLFKDSCCFSLRLGYGFCGAQRFGSLSAGYPVA